MGQSLFVLFSFPRQGENRIRAGERRRKQRLLSALLAHPCLPQLQDVAGVINKRHGEWPTPHRRCSYTEVCALISLEYEIKIGVDLGLCFYCVVSLCPFLLSP